MAKHSNQYAILAGQELQKLKNDFHNLALILNELSHRIESVGKLIEESEREELNGENQAQSYFKNNEQ